MNKEQILDNFRTYLLEKGFSNSSIQSYTFGLSSFLSFLYNNKINYLKIDKKDIKKYSSSLSGSNQSINSKLFSLKKYCEYLKEETLSEVGFEANFKKIRKRNINLISDKLFNEIINFIENNSKNDTLKSRDCLIFKLLYYLGIRVSDLVTIKIKDLNIRESSLLLDNKEVTLNENLLNDLMAYKEKIPDNSYLFFSFASKKYNFDKGLTVKSIEDIFNKYIKIIGENYTINDLRNSYSSNNKFNIPTINNIYSHNLISYDNDFIMFIN
ncbi:MAG TPA: site-specific integrase [Patescibacteria group bacterium]|nr:site-specific integrase [Patescibacteria group bacterium]